jgi:hypothetical protein|tara:strand:- start:4398 stop:4754 length:357 start_codon:yes stop_codon:yes gene_type:complete
MVLSMTDKDPSAPKPVSALKRVVKAVKSVKPVKRASSQARDPDGGFTKDDPKTPQMESMKDKRIKPESDVPTITIRADDPLAPQGLAAFESLLKKDDPVFRAKVRTAKELFVTYLQGG